MAGKPGQRPTMPAAPPERYAPGFLTDGDMRFALNRQLVANLNRLTTDLGGDLSYQEGCLAERFVHLEWQLSTWEAAARDGDPVDYARYMHGINALTGLARSLGLKRRAKPVPSLQEFLSQRAEHPDQNDQQPEGDTP